MAAADRERGLERIRSIVLATLQGHPARVYLFGSSAAGRARRSSDVDIAVESIAPLPPRVLAELREALEESTVPYDVDLVDLAAAPAALREHVKAHGIPWTD